MQFCDLQILIYTVKCFRQVSKQNNKCLWLSTTFFYFSSITIKDRSSHPVVFYKKVLQGKAYNFI